MYNVFLSAIKSIYPISSEVENEIKKALEIKHFKAGDIIIKRNKINDKLFFINQGMVRAYYFKSEGKSSNEVTSWLIAENGFVYIPQSFLTQSPSVEEVEVLEDAIMTTIAYEDLQNIYQNYPETNFIGRILTEGYLVMYDNRVRSLRMMSAKDRHDSFAFNFPELYHRAPLKYIASFLGITPETLSRVRGGSTKEEENFQN